VKLAEFIKNKIRYYHFYSWRKTIFPAYITS